MPCIVSARANKRSQAGKVVSSRVRRLNKQEISTKNGLLNFLPTKVAEGSGKSLMATFSNLITRAICVLSKSFISGILQIAKNESHVFQSGVIFAPTGAGLH